MKFKNLKIKIINYKSGFTIVETIVTIAIFSLMMVIVVSIFARAIILERRIVSAQRVQENATLVMESIAKEIRVSKIENQDNNCNGGLPLSTLTMVHPVYGSITYSLSAGNIIRQAGFTSILNSSEVKFTRMRFCITGSGTNDNMSPKVTILLGLENTKGLQPISANLQTTVTSRDIKTELED